MDNQFLNKGASSAPTSGEAGVSDSETFSAVAPSNPNVVTNAAELNAYKKRILPIPRVAVIVGIVVFAALIGGVILFARGNEAQKSTDVVDRFESKPLDIDDLGQLAGQPTSRVSRSIEVNGQFSVNGAFILQPSNQPTNPKVGQIYYDKDSNQLSYFNGSQFVSVGGSGTGTTVNNFITTGGGGTGTSVASVLLQGTSPGTGQSGNFNVLGTGVIGRVKSSIIENNGGSLYINPTSIDTTPDPGGDPVNLGLDVVGSQNAPGPGWHDTHAANKVTTGPTGGTLQSISVYFTGGTAGTHVMAAIYEDDGDLPSKPGARLATSVSTLKTVNGWTTLTMPAISLSPNTTYWVTSLSDDNTAGRPYNSGAFGNYCAVTAGFGFMPDPFSPLGCFHGANTYSQYATYLTSAGGGGNASQAHITVSTNGETLFRPSIDTQSIFTVQNSLGTATLFNIDAANERIAIGKPNASYKLDIAGGDINLSNSRALRFGGSIAVSAINSGLHTILTNQYSGGEVSVRGDNINLSNRDGSRDYLTVNGTTGDVMLTTGDNGDLSLTTVDDGFGPTGNITLQSGDSGTTASGNINIDTGTGIVDGTVINTKTFEAGTENMLPWTGPGVTVAQSFAQARSGSASLAFTGSSFAGILEDNNTYNVPVVPGHNYYFSAWVRAATVGAPIGGAIYMGSTIVPLTSVTDNTTGWTQMTGQGVAPAGSTFAYWHFNFNQGSVQTHYFDDIVTTDLSSASAISEVNIGTTNAQFVKIGNINTLGPTQILGTGLTFNGGVGNVTLSGGAININGSASSSLVTSSGSLTLRGTDTSDWGLGTKTSNGVGGDLTIHAGRAFGGNFTGGNLILRGGEGDGTEADGSVIVRPVVDNTAAFRIQDTATTSFFTADSSNYVITVAGTTTKFASLTLTNAHVRATQTNPPTIGTPSNCGTSPTAAVAAGSTDSAGSFTITTGTGGTSSTCDTVFTFNQPYGAAPKSIIVVGKTDSASALRQIYVPSSNTTTFNVSFATGAGGADSTTYSFNYWVIE